MKKKVHKDTIDKNFRDALKESYDYICQYPDCPWCQNVELRYVGGAECAHGHSRKYLGGRWHPDNCLCLCHHSHAYVDTHEAEKWALWRKILGDGRYDMLVERMRGIFKYPQWQRAEISKHYLEEKKRIQALRREGVQGVIELVAYD